MHNFCPRVQLFEFMENFGISGSTLQRSGDFRATLTKMISNGFSKERSPERAAFDWFTANRGRCWHLKNNFAKWAFRTCEPPIQGRLSRCSVSHNSGREPSVALSSQP